VLVLVPTENSVPINPHPCGTLIADRGCAILVGRTNPSLKAGSFCLVQASSASKQGVLVAKESGLISKSLVE
jgi:hypothetical protein